MSIKKKSVGGNDLPIYTINMISFRTSMKISHLLYRIWFDLTSEIEDGIVITDDQGTIHLVNRGIEKLFDVQGTTYIGRDIRDFFTEIVLVQIKNKREVQDEIVIAQHRLRHGIELQIESGPGRGQCVEYGVYASQQQDCIWKMSYFRKITRWKKTEEELLIAEERFRIIFQNIYDSVVLYTLDEFFSPGKFIEVNETSCRRLGYSRDELLRLSPTDIVTPDELGPLLAFIKKFRITGTQSCELREVTRTGDKIPVEINATLIKIRGDSFVIHISRDIRDRCMINQLQKQAFGQINQNLEQFAILNDKIRNPLSIIMTLASITDNPENTQIIEQVQVIDSLVDELDKGWIKSEKVRNFLQKYFAS